MKPKAGLMVGYIILNQKQMIQILDF